MFWDRSLTIVYLSLNYILIIITKHVTKITTRACQTRQIWRLHRSLNESYSCDYAYFTCLRVFQVAASEGWRKQEWGWWGFYFLSRILSKSLLLLLVFPIVPAQELSLLKLRHFKRSNLTPKTTIYEQLTVFVNDTQGHFITMTGQVVHSYFPVIALKYQMKHKPIRFLNILLEITHAICWFTVRVSHRCVASCSFSLILHCGTSRNGERERERETKYWTRRAMLCSHDSVLLCNLER